MSLSPVRAAVRSAMIAGGDITPEGVQRRARWGRVTLRGVRMYLTVLSKSEILVATAPGVYRAGEGAEAWIREVPRTRVGGTSRRYRMARARREAMS